MRKRLSILCVLFAACSSGGVKSVGAPAAKAAPAAPSVTDASAAPPSAAPPPGQNAPDPKVVAEVEATVKANNDAAMAEREKFVADGWTIVENVPAPDARLLTFDAALIQEDPDALRVQLGSTTPNESDLASVAKIARTAPSAELRLTAIEALGRMKSEGAQAELIAMLTSGVFGADESARLTITPLLRPTDLDAAGATAALLDNASLGEPEKNQIAFTLAAIGLRDGTTLPDSVLSTLSVNAQNRIAAMRALAMN
jgi:hypothetical protein